LSGLIEALTLVLTLQWGVALSLHAAYGSFRDEAEKQGKHVIDVLRGQLRLVIRHKHLTYPSIGLVGLAIGMFYLSQAPLEWFHGLPIWVEYLAAYSFALSYVFVETLVIYLGLQTLYALTSSLGPAILRQNRKFGALVVAASLVGSFIIGFGITVGWLITGFSAGFDFYNYGLALGFVGVFFVTGLGGISTAESLSRSAASYASAEKRRQLAVLFGSMVAVLGGFILFSYALSWLAPSLALQLFAENSTLGFAASFAFFGAIAALPIGGVYFVYLMVRTKVQQASRLVYITLLVVLSFAYIGYSEKLVAGVVPGSSSILSLAQLVSLIVGLGTFTVGYVEMMFAKPRVVEKKLHATEGVLMASLTFLLLFVVVGYTWGLPISINQYFYLREVGSVWGLVLGALGAVGLFFARKSYNRISRRKVTGSALTRPRANCGHVLDSHSRFCGDCGREVSSISQIREEKLVYKGAGRLLLKGTRHHSVKRKIASLIAGGPMGFLFFGRDETRKFETEGQLLVTPAFFRCGVNDYPIERMVGLGRTMPAPSVVLALKKGSGVESQLGWGGLRGELRKLIAELVVLDHEKLYDGLQKSFPAPGQAL
jgi:hypothetical protein